MSTHKNIDKICVAVTIAVLIITIAFMNWQKIGIEASATSMGYEDTLFDTSKVHTIDIVIDDWDSFIETAMSEEYSACAVVIDGEAVKNVAIRGKGNTSLSTVSSLGSQRYSFKIEFDQYQDGNTYHGLDKLCLNNIISDNTYMKDYLSYRMMAEFGADAPLCSYVWVTVNGEDWGLYLATESIEDSFMERVYNGEGELYKPDSMSMGGGGPGNGKDFNIEDFLNKDDTESEDSGSDGQNGGSDSGQQDESSDAGVIQTSTGGSQGGFPGQQGGQGGFPGQQPGQGGQGGFPGQQPGQGGNFDPNDLPDGFDPNNLPDGFNPGDMPDDWQPGDMPDGFDPWQQGGDTDSGDSEDQGESTEPGDNADQGESAAPGDNADQGESTEPGESSDSGSRRSRPSGGFNFGGFGGMGSDDVKLKYIDDDPDSYSNIFDNAKTAVTYSDKTRLIQSLKNLSEGNDLESTLDIDEVLRYFVVHNYVVNGDSYTGSMIHNYYLYENDGQLSMIPWDYNLAFGGFQGGNATGTVNDAIDSPQSVTGDGSRPMADWIFQNEEYTELYHQYFKKFLETVDIQSMIEEAYSLIAPYVEKDPTAFCTYEEFEKGVSTLKEFCKLRTESIEGQLDGTIPSTDSGQSADSSNLIDASSLTLSDMGTFSGGGRSSSKSNSDSGDSGNSGSDGSSGSGNSGGFSGMTPPDGSSGFTPPDGSSGSGNSGGFGGMTPPDSSRGFTPPDGSTGSGNSGGFGGITPPDSSSGSGSMQPPSGFTPPGSSANNPTAWVVIGISVAVLLAGIAVAAIYTRRKYR